MSGPMPKSSTQKQAKSPADSMGGVSPPTCKGARSGPFACQRIPTLLACFYSATLAWNLSAVDNTRCIAGPALLYRFTERDLKKEDRARKLTRFVERNGVWIAPCAT